MAKPSKKALITQYVRQQNWCGIGRAEWERLRGEFPEISETTVRGALAELGVPVDQPFAGVATKTLAELETSLIAMALAYSENRGGCRASVISAKDRCRFATLNQKTAPEKRAVKQEMLEWMLVWLGDPAMFAAWVALRKPLLQHE